MPGNLRKSPMTGMVRIAASAIGKKFPKRLMKPNPSRMMPTIGHRKEEHERDAGREARDAAQPHVAGLQP